MLQRIVMLVALIIGFSLSTGVRAQAMPAPALQKSFSIPKEWGALRAATDKCMVFEDNAGTVRMAYIESGLHNYFEVTRQ